MNKLFNTLMMSSVLFVSSCGQINGPITYALLEQKLEEIRQEQTTISTIEEDGEIYEIEEIAIIEFVGDKYPDLHKNYKEMSREQIIEALAHKLDMLPQHYVFRDMPSELRFSCARGYHPREEAWRKLFKLDDEEIKAIAAEVLWRYESKNSAKDIVALTKNKNADDPIWGSLVETAKYTLQPDAIIGAIQRNRDWGLWLATLSPNKKLVPLLLKEYKRSPDRYAVLALGASKDDRAFEILLKELNSGDYMRSGYGAQALGMTGLQKAEPHLIKALGTLRSWAQAKACWALGEVGTEAAIKYLKQPKKDSVISVTGAATSAVKKIQLRLNTDNPLK